ncbi:DUF2339 domain-containing protein [Shewanella sp. Isolate8]|uniref:DUF2339 domain-containing protein n=1 Tax=Shewanella sp. Isolate8 TaxID=2908529 RepID=UPI001EFC3537|nr:DUF2339 domain-containing protein [Shewanella sp. Isolate8]MCG9745263.1 DUF2339 domain-containing protein [Shewanella sp. Isolate8]
MTLKEDVNKLTQALEAMQSQQASDRAALTSQLAEFSQQLAELNARVNALEGYDQPEASDLAHSTPTHSTSAHSTSAPSQSSQYLPWQTHSGQAQPEQTHLASAQVQSAQLELEQTQSPQQGELSQQADTSYRHDAWQRQTPQPEEQVKTSARTTKTTKQKAATPGIGQQLANSAAQLQGSLGQLVNLLLGPFGGLGEQAKAFYQHYQAKGQGAVFLMTLAGIITLTLGFGYLLQYSINHWFSELGKALLGLVTANTVIAVGLFIRRARPGMEDYASGIVGLGVILNYLCIYFLGPYFELIPESAAFSLMLVNTLLGYGLAMKLETKVVAIIALCGGSLAPLMLLDASQAPLLYLPYLLIIGACSLVQSHRLNWPVLIEITALLHIACVQLLGFFLFLPLAPIGPMKMLALGCINALFYLYGLGSLRLQTKREPSARLLMVPVAMLCFTLYTLGEFTSYAGELFAINGVICALLYWKIRRDSLIAPLMLAAAGVFAGVAALYLISADLLGLVLLIEALLLLWLGAKHDFIAIRTEAYILLAMGLGSNLLTLFDSLAVSHRELGGAAGMSDNLILILTLTLSCAACYQAIRLIDALGDRLAGTERLLRRALQGVFGQLLAITALFIGYCLSPDFYLNGLPLIALMLLYLGKRNELRFTEIMAWFWLLPLGGLIMLGMLEAGSVNFAQQPLNAKLARIELFTSLLLAYYWYKKYSPQSPLVRLAYYVQLGCYLAVPLILLPKVLRSYLALLPIYLWLASAMALGLARFVRHRSLVIETQVLCATAMLFTAISCLDNQWQGLVALAIGALALGTVHGRYEQMNRHWRLLLRFPWQLSPFYFALVVAVAVQTLSGLIAPGWTLVFLGLTTYFALLLERDNALGRRFAEALRPGYGLAYASLISLPLAPIILHGDRPLGLDISSLLFSLSELGILVVLAWYLRGKRLGIASHKKLLPKPALLWGWHSLLAVSYFLWSYQLGDQIAAPVSSIFLVSHGSALMFLSLRPRQASLVRLAGILFGLACLKVLFIDMASFVLVQKVVAFIIIGIILLTVAYFYQKQKNRLPTPQ